MLIELIKFFFKLPKLQQHVWLQHGAALLKQLTTIDCEIYLFIYLFWAKQTQFALKRMIISSPGCDVSAPSSRCAAATTEPRPPCKHRISWVLRHLRRTDIPHLDEDLPEPSHPALHLLQIWIISTGTRVTGSRRKTRRDLAAKSKSCRFGDWFKQKLVTLI